MATGNYQMSDEARAVLTAYMSNAVQPSWPLITAFTLADMLRQTRQRSRVPNPDFQDRQRLGEYHTLVREMRRGDGTAFFRYFRMPVERFDHLLALVDPLIRPTRATNNSVSAAEKLAFTLRYLAHGPSIRSLAKLYRISPTVGQRIIRATSLALRHALEPLYLQPLSTEDCWRETANDFETELDFPNCVGAISGRHIHTEDQSSGSREGLSTVLFAVCDSKYRFTLVDVTECQSRDAYVHFGNSSIARRLKGKQLNLPLARKVGGRLTELPYVIAGDSAFPPFENMAVPFPEASLDSEGKRKLNDRLSRAERRADNALGLLASRWLILGRKITVSSEATNAIVWATVLLHNYLRTLDAADDGPFKYCFPVDVDSVTEDGRIIPGKWRSEDRLETGFTPVTNSGSGEYTACAEAARDAFKRFFEE